MKKVSNNKKRLIQPFSKCRSVAAHTVCLSDSAREVRYFIKVPEEYLTELKFEFLECTLFRAPISAVGRTRSWWDAAVVQMVER